MAIIYNGTTLSKLTYNGTNVDVVWVNDTSTTCCTRVFPTNYCMSASMITTSDISSVYCYGASGSFGTNKFYGQDLCLCACSTELTYNGPYSSVCFASLCLDTSSFVGYTLEVETSYVAGMFYTTSRCCMCGCGIDNVYSAFAGTDPLVDNGNTYSTVISGATTCIDLISSGRSAYGTLCCTGFNNCFSNFIRNVCNNDICVLAFYTDTSGVTHDSRIAVRIKDNTGTIVLCGTYTPTQACVVLN